MLNSCTNCIIAHKLLLSTHEANIMYNLLWILALEAYITSGKGLIFFANFIYSYRPQYVLHYNTFVGEACFCGFI